MNAASASHELRTPITALRLSLEDLTLWDTTPPAVRAELESALREVERLSTAVTRVLEECPLSER
jgi:signal transduction histidine kinase